MAGATTKCVDNGQTDAEVYVLRLVSGKPHPKSLTTMEKDFFSPTLITHHFKRITPQRGEVYPSSLECGIPLQWWCFDHVTHKGVAAWWTS